MEGIVCGFVVSFLCIVSGYGDRDRDRVDTLGLMGVRAERDGGIRYISYTNLV